MSVFEFCQKIQQSDPDLLQLLRLLDAIGPSRGEVSVVTVLTADTVNPWGERNAELGRHPSGEHQGKQL